ncbi:MAG: OsmC family protein [Candidatus Hodarchaeota archaeon]
MSDEETFEISLRQLENYQFLVDFQLPDTPKLLIDELPALGEGKGPNPSRILASSVAGCLSASLLFCLRKADFDPAAMGARVQITLGRNEKNRLRVKKIAISLEVEFSDSEIPKRFEKCKKIFEEFCVVTQSVRDGIPIDVNVISKLPEANP